jgi:hypothetical protein
MSSSLSPPDLWRGAANDETSLPSGLEHFGQVGMVEVFTRRDKKLKIVWHGSQ